MPKQVEAQMLGREGERWFASALPANWLLQPPLDDVGVDGVVVICEEGPLNGTEFRVQVKTSRRWMIRENTVQVGGLTRAAVMYWLTGFTPTLLVLYDSTSQRGYCEWVNRLAAVHAGVLHGSGKTLSLQVPIECEIGPDSWDRLRRDLGMMNGLISRRILSAGKALPLLQALHALTGALKGFDFAAHATKGGYRPEGEDHDILCQLEIACHRDVVRALLALQENLDGSGFQIEGIAEFARGYAEKCSSMITGFDGFVADPDTMRTVTINATDLEQRRAGFIRSILEAMCQLTAIGLQVVPEKEDG